MKLTRTKTSGFTLIEISLVILALLLLVGVLLNSSAGYIKGLDKARCVLNIQAVHKHVRSFANLNQLTAGEDIANAGISGVTNIRTAIIGPGKFLEQFADNDCPDQAGTYTGLEATAIPAAGFSTIRCSLATDEKNHKPKGATADGSEIPGW